MNFRSFNGGGLGPSSSWGCMNKKIYELRPVRVGIMRADNRRKGVELLGENRHFDVLVRELDNHVIICNREEARPVEYTLVYTTDKGRML
jgi:hypothetical protein